MKPLYSCRNKTIGFIKKLWLFTTFIAFSLQANAQCPPGDVVLTSPAEVNVFAILYPHCTAIQGNLTISGPEITNLDGFNALTTVGGLIVRGLFSKQQ